MQGVIDGVGDSILLDKVLNVLILNCFGNFTGQLTNVRVILALDQVENWRANYSFCGAFLPHQLSHSLSLFDFH